MDKLLATYSLRIPERLDYEVKQLPADAKKTLNEQILMTMAKVVHDTKFDPKEYLGE